VNADGPCIARTTDMAAIRRLGVACGLDDSDRGDEDVYAAWGAFDGDELVGSIVLEGLQDLDTVNWMAVSEAYRRRGLASRLYAALERDARARGMKRLWVTARTPAFFAAQGYRPVPPGDEWETLLGECPQCEQYGHGCTPQALCKDLVDIRPEDGATSQEETWHDRDCST
jgi:N-acetylglutamate synthase-like GNAT family acetyltransferase